MRPGSHHKGVELQAVALQSGAVMRGAVDILRIGEAQDAVRMAGGVEIQQLAQAYLLVPVRVELDRRAGTAADAADPHRSHRRMAFEHAHAHHGYVIWLVIDRRSVCTGAQQYVDRYTPPASALVPKGCTLAAG